MPFSSRIKSMPRRGIRTPLADDAHGLAEKVLAGSYQAARDDAVVKDLLIAVMSSIHLQGLTAG